VLGPFQSFEQQLKEAESVKIRQTFVEVRNSIPERVKRKTAVPHCLQQHKIARFLLCLDPRSHQPIFSQPNILTAESAANPEQLGTLKY